MAIPEQWLEPLGLGTIGVTYLRAGDSREAREPVVIWPGQSVMGELGEAGLRPEDVHEVTFCHVDPETVRVLAALDPPMTGKVSSLLAGLHAAGVEHALKSGAVQLAHVS